MFLLTSGAAGLLRRCGTASTRALPRQRTLSRRTLLTRKGDPVRCSSLDHAVAVVNHNDRVYVHGIAAVPTDMLQALSRRSDLRNVQLCHLHLEEKNPCDDPSLRSSFYTSHFFVGKRARSSVAQGTGHYIPVFLSEVPALMRRGILPIDVALLNVSPPDRHGYCSLGTEVAGAYPAAETAKIVVAQINPSMPRTFGSSQIHISAIDYVVEHDEPLPVVHAHISSDVERRIGAQIAELVPDGATLQMGIGAIPDAVLSGLHNHKDLGIHVSRITYL
ncbi:MAG: 4-hydroxybutyrate coenzyme A transferase [Olpidium bornovanus]|uniref:4-hydroxybutyrate coenzyme A transferase n=1 Tax=Olpidium bornovanus TaxID=278681 RepID=A0A8H7ZUU4_9FUNG|nr:MAG: 4-hydroxybutyrate coenzyme A transferase [Olpidium bornovanus]